MRKRLFTLLLLACLTVAYSAAAQERYVPDLRRAFLFNGDKVIEPEDDVFLNSLDATVFGIPMGRDGRSKNMSCSKTRRHRRLFIVSTAVCPGLRYMSWQASMAMSERDGTLLLCWRAAALMRVGCLYYLKPIFSVASTESEVFQAMTI